MISSTDVVEKDTTTFFATRKEILHVAYILVFVLLHNKIATKRRRTSQLFDKW